MREGEKREEERRWEQGQGRWYECTREACDYIDPSYNVWLEFYPWPYMSSPSAPFQLSL